MRCKACRYQTNIMPLQTHNNKVWEYNSRRRYGGNGSIRKKAAQKVQENLVEKVLFFDGF
jgi:hypothetical protein